MNARIPPPNHDDPVDRLLAVMAALRDREHGCPWDIEQTFATIAPYTIEEAYEVAEAIDAADMRALRDELGDLLLQVVYHARMAEESGDFSFHDVAGAIADKMIRRHPHVFGSDQVDSAAQQTLAWEAQKEAERKRQAAAEGRAPSALDGVARAYPALLRAYKLQRRAARVGFDWDDNADVLAKIEEEIAEVRAELAANDGNAERVEEELGDLFFSVVNLARRLDVEPEQALRKANSKFERRFRGVEARLETLGRTPEDSDLAEMDRLWSVVKDEER